jgi:hypothetical protein
LLKMENKPMASILDTIGAVGMTKSDEALRKLGNVAVHMPRPATGDQTIASALASGIIAARGPTVTEEQAFAIYERMLAIIRDKAAS